MKRQSYRIHRLLIVGALTAAPAMALSAALKNPTSPSATGHGRLLEEVLVTATRRPQAAMEVPLAISAFSGPDLQQRGITEVSQLAQVAPSLSIVSNTSEVAGTEVRIRGIGTSGNNPGLEASVGIFIDGVYRSRSGIATGDLLDIQSVEVLRGPQGTLFGRNTSAGAISIQSLRPDFEWGGYAQAEVGNYDSVALQAGVTGPLLDNVLAFRLAASYRERDGLVEDRLADRTFYDRDRGSAKGQLLWQPAASLELRLIADYRKKQEHCCAADYTIAGPTAPAIEALGGIVREDPFAYKGQTTFDSADEIDEWGVSMEVSWEIRPELDLTYIGAYRNANSYVNVDADTSNVDLTQGTQWNQKNEFSSQELRLRGVSGPLDWLLGTFYYDEPIDVDWRLTYGAQFGDYFSLLSGGLLPPQLFPAGAGDSSRAFSQHATGWALFSHNILSVNDAWDLVLGLRWSRDDKHAKSSITNNAIHCGIAPFIPYCPVPGYNQYRNEGEPTGTLKAVRNFDQGILYASYARGYKAGGFNLDRDAVITGTEFDPETVDTFELGGKWKWPDQALQLSSALFYSDFENFQLVEFDGVTFSVTNAGRVSSAGAELELTWLPLEGLTLTGGITYANTEFDKHPAVNRKGETLKGKQVPFAPTWSGTGSARYEHPLADYTAFGVLGFAYTGGHTTDPKLDAQTRVDAYTIVNARLGLRTADAAWEVSLWANNLLEEEYNQVIFDTPLQDGSWSAFRGEPRTYGVALRYEY